MMDMATDTKRTVMNSPRIKRILRTYQETAERTLNGPDAPAVQDSYRSPSNGWRPAVNSYRSVANPPVRDCAPRGPWKRSGPVSGCQGEQKKPADGNGCQKSQLKKCDITDANLEGEMIACFEVGGEQRLCMPQILSTVLRDFNPEEVYEVCEELHIFFSRCDGEQLESLKKANILPQHVTTCGLITYTNAERMCSILLRNQAAYKCRLPLVVEGLKVYHECFGGCKGVMMPEVFDFASAKCIQCSECGVMFAPAQFVSHSHSKLENGTIHWGFDPINWRSYLMLSLDQTGYPRAQELLDCLKSKFSDGLEKVVIKQEIDDVMPVTKKFRYDETVITPKETAAQTNWLPADVNGAWSYSVGLCKHLTTTTSRSSSEAKLPRFLCTDAPYLADEERLVPYTEALWKDRNFTPNVSLDPAPYKNLHDMYDDYSDKDPMDDEKDDMVKPSERWSTTIPASSAFATVIPSADSGNVSDDDSDETESVLSDKLPAINEDGGEICSRVKATWNARLGLLIQALEGEVQRSAGHDPMHDFMALQKQHSDIVTSLVDTNEALSQRHHYLWTVMEDKVRAMEEIRKNQDEELVSLKKETAMKMRENALDRCRLMQEFEKLSNRSTDSDLAMLATKYKEEAERLRKQLQNAEEVNAGLRREIAELHDAIDKFTHSGDGGGLYRTPVVVIKPEGVGAGSGGRPGWCSTISSTVCSPSV